jgi:hypothetical protein
VETIVNKKQPAGDHRINWNANRLPAGVYFYKFNAGKQASFNKMIFTK